MKVAGLGLVRVTRVATAFLKYGPSRPGSGGPFCSVCSASATLAQVALVVVPLRQA